MNIRELYQEIILEHGKNPRNLRKTENFNKDAMGKNPLCGDNVHIFLKLDENKKVEDISFEGSGCAISMASASIMTDLIKGKEEVEVKEIVNDFLGMIKENPELKSKNLEEDEKTKSRSTSSMPSTCIALSLTSWGKLSATGQFGEVKVIIILALDWFTLTS